MGKVFNALQRANEAVDGGAEEVAITPPEPQPVMEAEPVVAPPPPRKEIAEHTAQLGKWDDRLTLAAVTTGPVAESIRALRTRILFPSSGKVPRTLLVTSASPGEGKSFICANLAISLAQGVDNFCLLVDCDLRKPTQHALFGVANAKGLSDYLQHKRRIPELLQPSGIEKLSIFPAGPRSINPAELLSSAAMARLVDELSHRYEDRIVLFDSPPLHAASETSVLAQHVDGVVLVVRYGTARREYIKALADAIGREKILGVVFNAYRATVLDYKVFGYYEYQQEYYGEKK
ncbi:MAG: polysaccharide biosynthesis tyrosine autokinase [Desulfobulbus sp.]|nr:polysaccharide biosynthesis tyrosine autokinase [Desulfobulbus sp.]